MTPKEYLMQYRALDRRIQGLTDERMRWEALARSCTPSYGGSGGGTPSANKIPHAVEKITELEAEIDAEVDKLVELRREIERTIASVPSDVQRQVLEQRYLNQKKWEQIAVDMRIDLRWIYRLHGRALKNLTIESHYRPVL